MSPTETERIVSEVRGGDIDAYAEIVRAFEQDVWKVVAALLVDTQKSEDLVQQTFIQAYQQLHLSLAEAQALGTHHTTTLGRVRLSR